MNPIHYFLKKVDIRGAQDCWEWKGRLKEGYGIVKSKFISELKWNERYAHRVSWEFFHGPIPENSWIIRTCSTLNCVNPNHLTIGERTPEMMIGLFFGRMAQRLKSHCKRGHPYDYENTYFVNERKRRCRACANERSRIWHSNRRKQLRENGKQI